jgi:hypothetical protein
MLTVIVRCAVSTQSRNTVHVCHPRYSPHRHCTHSRHHTHRLFSLLVAPTVNFSVTLK